MTYNRSTLCVFKRQAFAISPIQTHATKSARKLFYRYNTVAGWPWPAAKQPHSCSLTPPGPAGQGKQQEKQKQENSRV